jgi:hypothetical protein
MFADRRAEFLVAWHGVQQRRQLAAKLDFLLNDPPVRSGGRPLVSSATLLLARRPRRLRLRRVEDAAPPRVDQFQAGPFDQPSDRLPDYPRIPAGFPPHCRTPPGKNVAFLDLCFALAPPSAVIPRHFLPVADFLTGHAIDRRSDTVTDDDRALCVLQDRLICLVEQFAGVKVEIFARRRQLALAVVIGLYLPF